jgi:hypothetical protein
MITKEEFEQLAMKYLRLAEANIPNAAEKMEFRKLGPLWISMKWKMAVATGDHEKGYYVSIFNSSARYVAEIINRNPDRVLAISTSREWFQFRTAEIATLINEKLAAKGLELISQEESAAGLVLDPILLKVVSKINRHVAKLQVP